MENLFYSKKEKILFWIAGYTADGSTGRVLEKIRHLKDYAEQFAATSPEVRIDAVNTDYIQKSSRYKYMRVFWADGIESPPADAFIIGDGSDWTMNSWLSD